MGHPLESAVLKLNRAEEHLKALTEVVTEYAESDFYSVRTEVDRQGRVVGRLADVQQPPTRAAVLLGDCAYNYRSALDHIAYQLAVGYTDPLPENFARTTAFPIFKTGPRFREKGTRGARHKMRGMSPRARASIERLQPYHRRKDPRLGPLWMLEELANIDKHRLIHLTAALPIAASGRIENLDGATIVGMQQFAPPVKDGAMIIRLLSDSSDMSQVQVDADLAVDIVFDKRTEARSVRGMSVIAVLHAVREAIAFCVLPELGREMERLFPGLRFQITQGDAPAP